MNIFERWFNNKNGDSEEEHFEGNVLSEEDKSRQQLLQKERDNKERRHEETTSIETSPIFDIDDTIVKEAKKNIESEETKN